MCYHHVREDDWKCYWSEEPILCFFIWPVICMQCFKGYKVTYAVFQRLQGDPKRAGSTRMPRRPRWRLWNTELLHACQKAGPEGTIHHSRRRCVRHYISKLPPILQTLYDSPYPQDYVRMGSNVPTEAVSHLIRFGYGSLHEAFVVHDWVVQMGFEKKSYFQWY